MSYLVNCVPTAPCASALLLCLLTGAGAILTPARVTAENNLVIAEGGQTKAVICVDEIDGAAATTRRWEQQAATDLAKFIGLMSGATPTVVRDPAGIKAALASDAPVFLVGELALRQKPDLRQTLDTTARDRPPLLRNDAIATVRDGARVYLAGLNDDAHYFAVASLLHQWGCRWYFPTDLGQCIPKHPRLHVGPIHHVYRPPFEIRMYLLRRKPTDVRHLFGCALGP